VFIILIFKKRGQEYEKISDYYDLVSAIDCSCGIVCACFGLSCGGDGSFFLGIRFL